MRVFIVLFIIFLYKTSSGDSSHSPHGSSESSDEKKEYRVLMEFSHSNAHVWLIVREVGHMMGQPFQVELKVQCHPSSDTAPTVDIMEVPVQDSFSVCNMDPESVVMNLEQTGIAMKTKSVDMNNYNNQVASGIVNIKPQCAKDTTIRVFSLENLCQTD